MEYSFPLSAPIEAAPMKMQKSVLFACLACLAGAAPSSTRAGGHDALATVQQKFDAFNRHDADAIERLYARDAALHSPDYPSLSGNKPIADTYRKIFGMIPDARDDLTSIESAGNHVYVQFVMRGHLGGAQDKPIALRLMSVYTIQNDRIAEDNTYYDRKM